MRPVPLDIMLPYWGDPVMARRAVDSVLAQTADEWRLTVVDDAYPDPTFANWLGTLDDERVTYVRKEQNEGITANFRTCVELARSDYLAILGADDVLLPGYVDTVFRALDHHPGVDILQPGVQVINEHGQVVAPLADIVKQRLTMPRGHGARVVVGEALAASLLRADWMYWPSLVFRRERIVNTPFRPQFSIIQDLAVVIDMVLDGATLLIVPEEVFQYRRHSSSASMAALLDGRRFAGEREYFALAAHLMAERGWRRAERAARCHLTSRLHALTLLPVALRGHRQAVPTLLQHAFAWA